MIKRTNKIFKQLSILVERTSLSRIALAFLLVIFGFALSYYFLGGLREGPGESGSKQSFWNDVYFSVVTISSLGYGDIVPTGYARVLSASEVLLGLAFMGIIVAKLSSARISFHVKRIYGTDSQLRLKKLADEFLFLKEQFPGYTQLFAEVPTANPEEAEIRRKAIASGEREITLTFETFLKSSLTIKEYIAFEADNCVFFDDAPSLAMIATGESLDDLVNVLTLFVKNLSADIRMRLLQSTNRRRLLTGLTHNVEVCNTVLEHSKNQSVLDAYRALKSSCERFPQEMFNFPEVQHSQPDQIAASLTEPQAEPNP